MLGHDHKGGMEVVRGETLGGHLVGCTFVAFLSANPRVPAQGYVPLGGTGMGWAMDTQVFTPVLP